MSDKELEGWGCAESDEEEFDRLLDLAEEKYVDSDDPDFSAGEFQRLRRKKDK